MVQWGVAPSDREKTDTFGLGERVDGRWFRKIGCFRFMRSDGVRAVPQVLLAL
ncbi:hypothetical protein FHS44_002300 [Streptosporangium saharense]|uniref:Uncharacterized protein n=1 Tax=Streptosporangium saharense TaxID=1706840 RepID=A0A7W7QKE1_9ACTN|nr:hypothetical protein [Streptosporangium saharense]